MAASEYSTEVEEIARRHAQVERGIQKLRWRDIRAHADRGWLLAALAAERQRAVSECTRADYAEARVAALQTELDALRPRAVD